MTVPSISAFMNVSAEANFGQSELAEEFERQAEWRSEKAKEHPDDIRNDAAFRRFGRLAGTVKHCPPEVIQATYELFEDASDNDAWLQMMNDVGIHYSPDTAEEFCRDFIRDRTGGGR